MSVRFVCQQCTETFPKWSGKCSSCNSWNTILEEEVTNIKGSRGKRKGANGEVIKHSSLNDFKKNSTSLKRYSTGYKDIDDVLGGGLVEGSVVMIAGQPGIGKSTLLMQIIGNINPDYKCLYITAEESADQVYDRAKRLKVESSNICLASSQSAEDIAETLFKDRPAVCIIDSIQTISVSRLISAPGTVSQVTNSIHLLSSVAKQTNTTLIVVGHVTKEGAIAGPKMLEHLVDVVLYIEGDRFENLRILRSTKNRYGSTQETALLAIDETGLNKKEGISASLIAQKSDVDGSVIAAIAEGNQPMLIEVQALVSDSSFGYPKRTASGYDLNRLNILIAVISKRTKLKIYDKDVFLNIAGGVKVKDPGADLAVCMAIASAVTGHKLNGSTAVYGEVGLGGEIRKVPFSEKRIKEAMNYKMSKIVGPQDSSQKSKQYSETLDLKKAMIQHLKK